MRKLLLSLLLLFTALGAFAQANVVVFNTNPDMEYEDGEIMSFTVTVTNTGNAPISNVNVSYPIPSAVVIPPVVPPNPVVIKFWWEATNGAEGSNVGVNNTIPVLAPNQTVTYTIHVKIPNGYTGTLSPPVVTWPQVADIQIVNTNNQTEYTPGETSVYTITVYNAGPAAVPNLAVMSALPAGIPAFSWSSSAGTSGAGPMADVIALGVGQAMVYTITIPVPATYTGNLSSVISYSLPNNFTDSSPTCPTCTDTDTQAPPAPVLAPDVVVVTTDNTTTFIPGYGLAYTVTVTNNGTGPANSLVVSNDLLAAGFTDFTWSGNGATGTNVNLSDTIDVLPAGETITYTITATVPADYDDATLVVATVVTAGTLTIDCTACTDTDTAAPQNSIIVHTENDIVYYDTQVAHSSVYTVTVQNTSTLPAAAVAVNFGFNTGSEVPFTWTSSNGASGTSAPGITLLETLALLPAGTTVTYTITTQEWPVAFAEPITATASATTTTPAFTVVCNSCEDTDLPELADIVVTNTNGQTIYEPGQTVTYTVTITNQGPALAENVVFSYPAPAGITSFTWANSYGTSTGTGTTINDVIASLESGTSLVYTVTFTVPAIYIGTLTTVATITSDTVDPTPACITCTDTDDAPTADIVIAKTLNTGTAYTAGTNAVYTVTVTNDGPAPAQNITVQDLVPAGIVPATVNWFGSNGTSGTGNLNDVIPQLAVDAQVVYTITIPVPSNFDQDADIVNTATATGDTTDPDAANNTVTLTATPNPLANIITVKTNYQDEYLLESTIEYTITVTNPGPSDAFNVVVHDARPYEIQVMSWQGNGTGGSGQALHNIIPVLAAGESVTYTMSIFIPDYYAAFVGPLTNTVTVTSDTPDPVPACTTCVDIDTPAGNFVKASDTQYTVPELIEDVLIDVECVGIDNVTWSTGLNYGQQNGIAYFHRNNSDFPIQEGVVLVSGNAIPGPNLQGVDGPNPPNTMSDGDWPGDTELQNYVPGINQVASWIKFNFVPVSNSFSFNYLFASEEYGDSGFECTFTDVFAFILTDTDTGVVQNLAVIPASNPPIPVGVTTVHLDGGVCGAANPQYFGQYNTGAAGPTAPINFNGQTVVMQASAIVVPNHNYTIKLVVANGGDGNLNSAVFIEAGSFDIGQPALPGDITLANQQIPLCYGDVYMLESNASNPDMLIKWKQDGQWMFEEDGVTYLQDETIPITEPGTYTVMGYFASNPDCFLSDEIIIEFNPEILPAPAQDLTICDDPLVVNDTWDLSLNDAIILANFDEPDYYYVSYYTNMNDVVNGEPGIWPPTTYPGQDGQVMIAVIQDTQTLCYVTDTFVLHKNPQPVSGTPANILACDVDEDGSETFDLTVQDAVIINGQSTTLYAVTYHETANDAQLGEDAILTPDTFVSTGQTIYVRLTNVNAEDCFDVAQFDVIVTPQPVLPELEDVFACDTYTLPALTSGGYFSQPGGVGPITGPITNTQIVYVRIVQGVAPNTCSIEGSFNVTIYETPEVDTPVNVEVCDSYVLPALTVGEYHTGQNGTGDIVASETEVTETTTFYIYAANGDDDTVCFTQHEFVVTINNAPQVIAATPLEACDELPNDNYATFDLTLAGTEVIDGQTGLTVTYHETQDDADSGDNEIPTPTAYVNVVGADIPGDDIHPVVYIRVIEEGTTTNCATVVPLTLIVHEVPEIPSIPDYIVCDDNNSPDGLEIFDLTTKNSEATTDATDVVTYYLTEQAAQEGTPAIASPATFESGTAQVWVRVESAFGCAATAPINLVVNPLPVVATNMEPFYACEDTPGVGLFDFDEIDPVVTQGAAGYTVAYYATEQDAWDGGENYLISQYPSESTTIYARVEDAVTLCATVVAIELEVLPAPIAPQPAPLQECDPNIDGMAEFDMTGVIAAIEAALGNTVTVTIHETEEDAIFDANAIPNPGNYENVDLHFQTVYIRVESSLTECFDIVTLDLIVNPSPQVVDVEDPFQMCDNGSSDSDGLAVFDLTTYAAQVLGTLDPTLFTVSYFADPNNAENNISPIPAPASYSSLGGTVYIRVTNNATGCYGIAELELIVNPLPVANQPVPYTLCDDDQPNGLPNQQEIFDLTSKIDEITGGADGVEVTFHDTYQQAVGNTDAITTADAYTNQSPVETIFVRVTDNETGCYRIVLLDVRVEPLPVLVPPTADELVACDTNGLGISQFDLTELIDGMVNNGANIDVAFYETLEDALENFNAIPNPESYTNDIAPVQNIWVVATNTVTGCQSNPLEIQLVVSPAPQAPELEGITLCDEDSNNQNAQTFVDLTLYEGDIYQATGAAPGTLTIHYFTSEGLANAGAPRITTPAHYNASNNQVIWVRVELTNTECYSLTSFEVNINTPAALTRPTMLVQCDEDLPNDARTTFDLTQKDNEILGPLGIGLGNTVAYYNNQADYEAGEAAELATAYINPVGENPKTLYVVVTTPDGCRSYTTLTVKVLPLPVPNTTPDALELCDTNATGDGQEAFNLTLAEADIRNNQFTVSFTYYPTLADAEANTNVITTPTAYVSGTGSVWVRVSANSGNTADPVCYRIVELPLIVHPLPAQGTIAPYAICEQNTDGFATFDFNTHLDEILGANANPDDYTVIFRYNGNLISYIYTNVVPFSQTVDVYVEHEGTGCNTTIQLTLLVEEQAIAYDVVTPDFDVCDTDGDNDGEFIIDLTQADADIIGTQNPAIHAVTYYTSEADALAGTNPIATPAAFNATTQTIWAEIINTSTVSGCPDYTSFEVVIELLPEPVITTADDVHTICVDFITGQPIRTLTLQSNVAPNGHIYDWYLDGALVDTTTDGQYVATAPGTYTVIVTGPAPNECESAESAGFTVIQSGPASPINGGFVVSNAFGEEQVITVLVEGYGQYQYSLYEEGPWQNSNVFTGVAPGTHTIYVRDTNEDACGTLPLTDVSIINYPHYFTPNADGYNDTWNVIGLAGDQYQAIIYIFDRYGKLIKQISPDGEGWDGTFNGNLVPSDDYWFTVEFTEGNIRREFKAHFALKR